MSSTRRTSTPATPPGSPPCNRGGAGRFFAHVNQQNLGFRPCAWHKIWYNVAIHAKGCNLLHVRVYTGKTGATLTGKTDTKKMTFGETIKGLAEKFSVEEFEADDNGRVALSMPISILLKNVKRV